MEKKIELFMYSLCEKTNIGEDVPPFFNVAAIADTSNRIKSLGDLKGQQCHSLENCRMSIDSYVYRIKSLYLLFQEDTKSLIDDDKSYL